MNHSIKGYADDATLISTNIDSHCSILQEIDKRAANLHLMLKPFKCVLFLFDGVKHLSQGIALPNRTAKLISEDWTIFFGKLLDASLSSNPKNCNLLLF